MFHVEHARGFAAELAGDVHAVLDLGSGGGVPGLILAVEHPELKLTLVDGSERRCAFLSEAVRQLGIDTVVRCGRAEELAHLTELRGLSDAVVSRSFGAPAVVAECAAPLLRVGGRLIVSEPPDHPDRWPADALRQLGLIDAGPRSHGGHGFRRLDLQERCPSRYPRRVGVPSKRPLFTNR